MPKEKAKKKKPVKSPEQKKSPEQEITDRYNQAMAVLGELGKAEQTLTARRSEYYTAERGLQSAKDAVDALREELRDLVDPENKNYE